ncbi:hypothetical protein cypCar_00045874, partial [Cyprinus carpio]
MKIIWTFTLLMIPGVVSSISVTGYSGGGVNITCRYDREYTDNAKYFCRGQWKTTCSDLIKTDMKNENKWVDSGRFSLFDYTRAALFTVTFRNLSEQDSGMYWCAADISWGKDSYTEVKLKVVTGGGVNITCTYDREYTDNAKYFCKGQKPDTIQIRWCSDLIKTDKKNKWVDSGRFSLFDDTRAAVFTVTFRDLSEQDSGTYWCGADISWGKDSYTEVNLNVVTGSSLIIFLVLVLLVLIIIGLLLLFIYKKHQSR